MNILVATGLYAPEIGGPATYTALLEEYLPARGYTVTAVPFSESRHLPKMFRHVHYGYRVFLLARQADVVFAQDVVSVGLPARIAAALRRVSFWVRVPGDYAWEQSVQRYGVQESIDEFQIQSYGLRVTLLRLVQRFVTRTAHQVITPSQYFKDLVTGWGVDSNNIAAIYNGVDLEVLPTKITKPAKRLLVSAGRLVPWKGFASLITLMPQLPEWHLVILGSGPDRDSLLALAAEHNVSGRVQLAGRVSREEVFGWCAVADAFVLNTGFESFSFQVVEAMAAGAPLIVTNVGSLPELTVNADVGTLVPVDDIPAFVAAIKDVEHDPARWQARGERAKLQAQQFTIAATIDAIDALLQEKIDQS